MLELIGRFLVIAKCGSFSKAAELLYVTQPTLSRQIHTLEQEFGTPLLERSSSGIRLTEAGKILEEEGRSLLQEYRHIQERISRTVQKSEVLELKIGVFTTANNYYFKQFEQMNQLHPEVSVSLLLCKRGEALRKVMNCEVDIGIVSEFEISDSLDLDPQLRSKLIYRDREVMVTSKNDPIASQESCSVEDVAARRLLFFQTDPPLGYHFMYDLCRSYGWTLPPKPDTGKALTSEMTTLTMVRAGQGIMLMPKQEALARAMECAIVEIRDMNHTCNIYAVWLNNNGKPALKHFLDSL